MSLFERNYTVGIFRGFEQGGLEFHADLVMPYKDEFQSSPMHGQFVIVQLENDREAVFGRITTISAQGRLVSPIGEDYAVRAVLEDRPIPEDLRDQYLKYKVEIRVLGVLREENGEVLFIPSHRRLPHVGARVAFPGPDLLKELANANDKSGVELGYLAFGEFVYAGSDEQARKKSGFESWVVAKDPPIMPRFDIHKLVARRSFVFARAGFGKSNLVKLLFANLYAAEPTVLRRGERIPVGTVIFDPDGEYFWPDDAGRPGLCDVPELTDKLVVFTNREIRSRAYQSFVVGTVKLDIRVLPPEMIVGIAVSSEKQDQQNIARLKGLSQSRWADLVDLIHQTPSGKLYADPAPVQELLEFGRGKTDDPQINATISNMIRIVRDLHDPASQLLPALKDALAAGKLCVVDISQMRGRQGLQLAGVILAHIFQHNQDQFTSPDSKVIPTIAVLEEAQSVLSAAAQREDGPFVSWVKEGRKYGLGAMLITQQPGSIPGEILSQGDNFFIFHLLAQSDLIALKKANAHFSEDLLASLLNEPLVGHGIFWSSAPGEETHARPYPLSVRVKSFNGAYELRDSKYDSPLALDNYARKLRQKFTGAVEAAASAISTETSIQFGTGQKPADAQATYFAAAVAQLARDSDFLREYQRDEPMKWGRFQHLLVKYAPSSDVLGEDAFSSWAFRHVRPALAELFGSDGYELCDAPDGKRAIRFVGELKGPNSHRSPQPPTNDEPPF